MATSSISADIKAANSKLAQFMLRKEEEEMLLQIGKRKVKVERERKQPGGRARWHEEPDFKFPSPMVDRPRTKTGATSFHFSFISVSKQAFPTVNGRPLDKSYKPREMAVDHSIYIERDGAAEMSAGAQHAAYIERPHVIEQASHSEAVHAVLTGGLTNDEAQLLGLQDIARPDVPSVFSNISEDPFERQEYWRAVERTERNPRTHQIILDPEVSPRWWAALASTSLLDVNFKNHALLVAEKYRQHFAAPLPASGVKPPFKAPPFTVTAEQAGRHFEQAMAMPGYDRSLPPLSFKSGRGGRIQFRMVAELPHEVSAEDRALIVQNFCDKLGGLEKRVDPDGTERHVGMMYTAVIHAPDPHNDRRNYHLHVVAHDRPARFLHKFGQWDFEVAEVYQHLRTDRVRYPFRQIKIGEVTQGSNKTGKENSGDKFIPALRRDFARITNSVLAARGIERRYDPRTYKEMGIDRTPTEHLGTKAAALESIGVPTAVGKLNAIAIWSDSERAIAREAKQLAKHYKESQTKLRAFVAVAANIDGAHPLVKELRALVVRRGTLIEHVVEDRQSIMTFDHMEAKAKSRAIRTRQTCLQYLADIENRKADGTTRQVKAHIQKRWAMAQAHIEEINAALEPHREPLAIAAREIEKREAQIQELNKAIESLHAAVDTHLNGLRPEPRHIPAPPPQKAPAAPAKATAGVAPSPSAPAVPPDKPTPVSDPASVAPGVASQAPVASPSGAAVTPSSSTESTPTSAKQTPPKDEQRVAPQEQDHATDGTAAKEDDAIVAPIEPVTMEGLPIVTPTIGPAPIPPEVLAKLTSTPEGLEALRPQAVKAPSDVKPTVVINDLDHPERPAGATLGAPAEETTIDRRKKVAEPTLFPVEEKLSPVKPGTSRAVQADWEALFERIIEERILIKKDASADGVSRFTVPALGTPDLELLNANRFANRTQARLAAIYEKQQLEIDRLVRWVKSEGKLSDKLILEGRTVMVGDVRRAVTTLMANWGHTPEAIEAINEERERRLEVAKKMAQEAERKAAEREAAAKAAVKAAADHTRKQLLAEAAEKYPAPDQVYTPLVAEFTRLLRELAPDEVLQAAAARIHENAYAREDVNRHTVELATAYSKFIQEDDLPQAYMQRIWKDGRG